MLTLDASAKRGRDGEERHRPASDELGGLAAEEIASGELVRRRAKWRRIRRRAALALFAVFVAPWLGYETLARRAHMDATRRMLRKNLLEEQRYDEAIGAYQAVADVYRWSTVALYDAPQSIAELEAKRGAAK